jgi:broad specificity phosphatase PhoE
MYKPSLGKVYMIRLILSLFIPFALCAEFNINDAQLGTHIIMVRHGETDRNAQGKEIQGWIDDDAAQLNAKGHRQADQLGKILTQHYGSIITTIYSSPLGRCLQTAHHIAYYFPEIPIVEDRRFMEICHGQHDMMSYRERNAYCLNRYAELDKEFKENNPHTRPDRFFTWKVNPLSERETPPQRSLYPLDGSLETIFQLFTRGTAGCDDIGKTHSGETILISTHAALIKTLADEAEYRERGDESPLPVYFEHRSSIEYTQYLPGNCSLYHFIWEEGKLSFLGTEDLLPQN